VEIGFAGDGAPRVEGQFFTASGRVAVVVHSTVVLPFELVYLDYQENLRWAAVNYLFW
jgi:hypothetical protein